MKTYIDKAAVLIEALPYIQKFKGKRIVIKYGGSVISEEVYCESILRDVVFMRTVGMHPIIVHGGGKAITKQLKDAGIIPKFIHGLRYTDKDTMKIVEKVLRGEVSKHIADIIKKFGSYPLIMNGIDEQIIKCVKKEEHLGRKVDLGFVGDIIKIDKDKIISACDAGQVPVIAPVGMDDEGNFYNINADCMAGELASVIDAEKMVYLSDIPGILRDIDDPDTLFSSIKRSDIDHLIETEIIHSGMIPKIKACIKSLDAGAKKTHVIDGRLQHSLLLEIFTDRGVGTEIIHD